MTVSYHGEGSHADPGGGFVERDDGCGGLLSIPVIVLLRASSRGVSRSARRSALANLDPGD